MTTQFARTTAQVEKAVETAQKNNSAYAAILDFYGRVFIAQEESKSRLQIKLPEIPGDILDLKRREKFPLVEIKDFSYDATEAADLLITISNFAREANPKLAECANAIIRAVDTNLDPDILFKALLNGNEAVYENISEKLKIEKQILGQIAYHSLKPSLCTVSDRLAAYLQPDEPWLKGYCPICGSAPILSFLTDGGTRSLACSFCWHHWQVKRLYCPFCDNSDDKDLQYLFNEEEKDLRIDLCNKCRKYLKSLDTRKADRLIYPPLEQITTLHLDIKAREEGFESGVKLSME